MISLFPSGSWVLSNLTAENDRSAVRFLLYWRLILCAVTLLGIGLWHSFYRTYELWLPCLVCFSLIFAWTTFALCKHSLQNTSYAPIREVCIDLLWIFVIALLTGRSANPFIYYFLVVVAFSATLLSQKQAWFISLVSIALYTVLLYLDVQEHFEHFSSDYRIHLIGMWLNYLISTTVICYFVSHLISQVRKQNSHIRDFREKTLKNEQLIGLATVAASAVHDLATPLSTLGLLVNEQIQAKTSDSHLKDDLELMSKQITRCNHTIDELSLLAQKSDERNNIVVANLINNVKDHYSLHFPDINIDFSCTIEPETKISCTALFHYALINLINNAIESSNNSIMIDFSSSNLELLIEIGNTCCESKELIEERWGKLVKSEKNSGLGIGSMLANSTIEQQGGRVIFDAQSTDVENETTIVVSIFFPITP